MVFGLFGVTISSSSVHALFVFSLSPAKLNTCGMYAVAFFLIFARC